jgi:tetratricopeptide (TPR) repeat protein
MGKKRAEKRKCLFLHPACILAIFLLFTGCALTTDFKNKWQEQGHLKTAEELVARGDYDKALKEYEKALRLSPTVTPGDSILFHMGLIRAHPDNPQRNYNKALECFRQLVRDFPRSALKEETMVWIGAIDELTRRERQIKNLEETVSALKKRLNALKEIDISVEEKKRGLLPLEIDK